MIASSTVSTFPQQANIGKRNCQALFINRTNTAYHFSVIVNYYQCFYKISMIVSPVNTTTSFTYSTFSQLHPFVGIPTVKTGLADLLAQTELDTQRSVQFIIPCTLLWQIPTVIYGACFQTIIRSTSVYELIMERKTRPYIKDKDELKALAMTFLDVKFLYIFKACVFSKSTNNRSFCLGSQSGLRDLMCTFSKDEASDAF